MSILTGIKIIEIQGIGPGPFCGMHLADLGADVVVIERPGLPAFGDIGDANHYQTRETRSQNEP